MRENLDKEEIKTSNASVAILNILNTNYEVIFLAAQVRMGFFVQRPPTENFFIKAIINFHHTILDPLIFNSLFI